ncbi:MAG: InlB B-repeat-containing protein, partial [Lachnospiraceae bacterium]|nr:InlB B-repeat-containing protein [Lachnospiraceae bacterium]
MNSRMNRAKRLISYILFYALLCGVMEPAVTGIAFAAASQKQSRAAINYLQPGMVSTEAGIIVDGRKVRLETYGSRFFVIDNEQENGFAIITTEAGMVTTGAAANEPVYITTGAGLVSSGTAISLTSGLSKEFEITGSESPALFSFRTTKLAGNCRQFRIITEAEAGFEVWLLDRNLQPIAAATGMGGSNILRYALENYSSCYLLVCGDAGTSGKLIYSDIIDDYGADFSTAGDLAFNRDYVIETEIAGDVDMMTFQASSTVSTYRMNIQSVSGSGGTFEVFDQNWRKLAQYSGTINSGAVNRVFTPELGKRYYFRFASEQTGRKILLHISQNVVRYQIIYHLHGGKNDKKNPTSYVSTTSKFRLKKATRSKYLFDGWYTDTT